MTLRLGVLASGSGSNFEAIVKAIRGEGVPPLDAQLRLLLCDEAQAPVLARAERLGISHRCLPRRSFSNRAAFEQDLVAGLQASEVEWVVLAGYMRLCGPTLLNAFPKHVLNIHPALLPAFPGLHAARQALEAQAAETGCTVHLVDAGMDTGARLAQARVPILEGDDETRLQTRIQAAEHRLYPSVLRWISEGHLVEDAEGGHLQGVQAPDWLGLSEGCMVTA